MPHPAELIACTVVHFPPYAYRLSPCHIRALDEFQAADDDSASVFSSVAGVTCVGGVETGCFVCHDGCEFADDDPFPVFSSGARTTRIGAVDANAFGAVCTYGTYCRYCPPSTSMYLPGTEASDVTPGGCKDADVVPAPELGVVSWSKCEAAGLWVWFTEVETVWSSMSACGCGGDAFGIPVRLSVPVCRCGGGGGGVETFWLSMPPCRCGGGGGGVEAVWLSMLLCSCGGGSFGTAWLVLLTGHDTSVWISMPPCRGGGGGFAIAGPVSLTFWLSMPPCRCGGGGGGGFAIAGPVSLTPHVTVE